LSQELIFKLTTIFSTLQTQGRFQLNASAFEVKRLYVLIKTYLHFSSNTSVFFQASSRTKK
ncbi:hypothetical protein, partial [Phocaeicola plebeius]|uniref:hypothetical protein n=1 Tax=Phocaeicola plebeius TaxID=310297 RepID=UPI0026EE50FC